jgi:hypothetical protein
MPLPENENTPAPQLENGTGAQSTTHKNEIANSDATTERPAPVMRPERTVNEWSTPKGWVKLARGGAAEPLITDFPNCFLLAAIIALRARYNPDYDLHGLAIGEALIGDFKEYGLTEQKYRTAKKKLESLGFATFKSTSKGTIAKLLDASIFVPHNLPTNGQNNGQLTDKQRTANGRLTTNREGKKGRRLIKEEKDLSRSALESGKASEAKPSQAEEIYELYPRKIGKLDAIRKIAKAIKDHGFELIADKTKQFAQAWANTSAEEIQFCPYPATWFHKGRFLDDASTYERKSQTKEKLIAALEAKLARIEPNIHESWQRRSNRGLVEEAEQLRAQIAALRN